MPAASAPFVTSVPIPPGDRSRLFVVEQAGRIRTVSGRRPSVMRTSRENASASNADGRVNDVAVRMLTSGTTGTPKRIELGFDLLDQGKIRILASSGAVRSTALPDVPTTMELGLKDSAYLFWTGIFVPAKTPRDIVEKLHAAGEKVRNAAPSCSRTNGSLVL